MRLLKSSIGSRIGEGKHTDAGEMTFVPGRGRGINHRSVYHHCSCRGSPGGQNARNRTEIRNQKAAAMVQSHWKGLLSNVGNGKNQILKICKNCCVLSLMHRYSSMAPKHCTTLFSKWWAVKSLEWGMQCRGYRGNYSELRTGWLPRECAYHQKVY